jgi:hypothetical protein
MGYPMKKTKDEVLEILSNQKTVDGVLENFNSLPEEVTKDGIDYKLSLVVTKIDEFKTNYEFNYYSKGTAKFLLEYKIFTNIADSISYLKNGLNG